MKAFFATYRLYIEVAIFAAVVLLALWGYNHVWNKGYSTCEQDVAYKTAQAKEMASSNVAKVEKQHEKNIKRIQDMPDNDTLVGPIVRSVIDGLRGPK